MTKTYTTSRGVTVEILGIQTLLEKFEAAQRLPCVPHELAGILGAAMPRPDAPTYDVKGINGIVEKHLHDETTVETESERAAWEAYQKQLAAYNADRIEKQKRLVFLHGIKYPEPAGDAWAQAQAEIGIEVPADPAVRKLHYIETEVCGGVGDFVNILKLCMMAGLPEESLQLAEESFQRSVGEYAAKRFGHSAGQVDDERPVRADGGGDPVGAAPAVPVRRPARRRES